MKKVGYPCRCVLAGGLTQGVIKRLNELLEGTVTVEPLKVKPVMGALEIAREIKL